MVLWVDPWNVPDAGMTLTETGPVVPAGSRVAHKRRHSGTDIALADAAFAAAAVVGVVDTAGAPGLGWVLGENIPLRSCQMTRVQLEAGNAEQGQLISGVEKGFAAEYVAGFAVPARPDLGPALEPDSGRGSVRAQREVPAQPAGHGLRQLGWGHKME